MDAITSFHFLALVAAVFFAAGTVKGVVGMGLPAIVIALLSLVVLPAEAAALLVLPSLLTNLWQSVQGSRRGWVTWRLAPFLGALVAATLLVGALVPTMAGWTRSVLGAALAVYALYALSGLSIKGDPKAEPWAGILAGWLTGMLVATTGVAIMPTVPYLQGLGLERDALVQALGVTFVVVALSMGAVLLGVTLDLRAALVSLGAVLPALAGMAVGRRLRRRLNPALFRRVFLLALLLMGGHLIVAGMR